MNKRVKKRVTVLAALVLLVQVGMVSAFADEYEYTVRVYAGNDAVFADGSTVMEAKCAHGETFPFSMESLDGMQYNEKYYIKGLRQSGRDNNVVNTIPVEVTEDMDYVVAYGIKGELVNYTVNFVDQAGNELASPQSYVGNVGDKPVISFLYIEGYEPQAYNLTKTLSVNEADNIFTFVYRAIAAPAAATPSPSPAAEGSATDAAAAGEAGGEGEAAGGEEAGAEDETAIDEEEAPLDEGPQDILDLDHEDTPLAQQPTERQQEQAKDRTMMFASIGILAVALAALIAFIILFMKSRKGEKDAR